MQPQTIIFMGPQGSGKGTQVDLCHEALAAAGQTVVRIQTGDLFRSLSQTDTYAANYLQECLAAGQLVPDALTSGLVVERILSTLTGDSVLIFDGYPRNQAQVETLQEVLRFFGREAMVVLHLATADAVVKERMLERGRSDDTPEIIAARLATYHQETEPLLTHFRELSQVTVHDIDGADTVEAVHEAIMKTVQ